jgi:hypothetical protein
VSKSVEVRNWGRMCERRYRRWSDVGSLVGKVVFRYPTTEDRVLSLERSSVKTRRSEASIYITQ